GQSRSSHICEVHLAGFRCCVFAFAIIHTRDRSHPRCLFTCASVAPDKFRRAVKALAAAGQGRRYPAHRAFMRMKLVNCPCSRTFLSSRRKKHGWPVTQSADASGGDLTWVAVDASFCFAWL